MKNELSSISLNYIPLAIEEEKLFLGPLPPTCSGNAQPDIKKNLADFGDSMAQQDANKKLSLLDEGRLQDQIAFVHKNFGKSKKNKQVKPDATLQLLSLEASLPQKGRLDFLQAGNEQIRILSAWNNNLKALLALNFAGLKALPAKIVSFHEKQTRFSYLRFGRLTEQITAVLLTPIARKPAQNDENIAALPEGETRQIEENTAQKIAREESLEANSDNNYPAMENYELWRYEIALGRDYLKNRFLNEEGNEPDVPYSIPAYFPTHQWVNIALNEERWLDDPAEGEWNSKRIATRPVDL